MKKLNYFDTHFQQNQYVLNHYCVLIVEEVGIKKGEVGTPEGNS